MNIRIVHNGETSPWARHTKKKHRALMKNPPDAVIIRIRDFYPGSPVGETCEMPFAIFHALAREFVLQGKKQDKSDARHLDDAPLDELEVPHGATLGCDPADELEAQECDTTLYRAIQRLSPAHHRRLVWHYLDGLTMREIADLEGTNASSIQRSIKVARKKVSRRMETDATKAVLVSDYNSGGNLPDTLLAFTLDKATGTFRVQIPATHCNLKKE